MASVVNAITVIDTQILAYLPAVIAGTQAAEQSTASGAAKLQAVVNGILAGSAIEAGSPNVNVAAVASLVNLVVSIFNATGVFSHKTAVGKPAA